MHTTTSGYRRDGRPGMRRQLPSSKGGADMAWWVWLILAWVVVAVVGAVWLGLGLRPSEARDWVRRGRPERRSGRRHGGYDDWVRSGRPERRSASSEQDRARV